MKAHKLFHEITACRICSNSDLAPVIDLGQQALTGCFPAENEPDAPKAPLELIRCEQCGLVQLRHSVDTSEMFGDNYGYVSGLNATMRQHLNEIATAIHQAANLSSIDAVLDIGCNDGTLLKSYPNPELACFGIDPTANMFRHVYPEAFQVHAGFFDAETYLRLSQGRLARAVTSISMFYDLEDPSAFVRDVARILASDGVWVLEQSHLGLMLEQNAFDTICHEHLEYYSYAQIDRLLQANGLHAFDVRINNVNGGSFQIWACKVGAPYPVNASAIERLQESEAKMALETDRPYATFRERVSANCKLLIDFLNQETAAGRKVYVYGASTKGNVLLQYCGLNYPLISGCAERNPAKWGRRTPGTGIPIVSEEEARTKADHFLVLPWHFRNEFVSREGDFLAKGGSLIFPLPNFEVVSKH